MGKKSKKTAGALTTSAAGQVLTDKKKGLISDTTWSGLNKTTWQGTYNLIESKQPTVTVVEATAIPLENLSPLLRIWLTLSFTG